MYAPEEDPDDAQDDDRKDDENQDFLEIDADIVSIRSLWGYSDLYKLQLNLLLLSRKQSKDTSID